jgi:cytochrome c biogenesis protein CcmG/thiol:disulfide interchange protein DsbE
MRLKFIMPAVIFVAVAAFLYAGLYLNPRDIPSALIDHPVPIFDLKPVPGSEPGLASADLRAGKVVLVNVFASWCVSCREEHPLLLEMKRKGDVPIYGLDYKDDPKAAAEWLGRMGDPYSRTGLDLSGRVGIDWGVYGVPETYVITKDGRIAYKQIGPITPTDLNERILPLVRKLQAAG